MTEDRFERVEVRSRRELREWLTEHHRQHEAVWLVTYRLAVPDRYVPHEQVLDELIAFGWIDGIRRRIDERVTRQLISPRRTQPWARSYKDRVERLIAEGAVAPVGLESVRVAKASGMWDAMNDVDALVVPDDLEEQLLSAPPARTHFDAFPPSTRHNILRWIASAKMQPTRDKRIAATVAEARENRRVKSNG